MKKIREVLASNLVIVIAYELLEELLEELIALGITTFLSKALTAVFAIGLTQTTKVLIKRFIKSITKKGGNDKMEKLKEILTFLYGNKLTAAMISVSAVAGYGAYLAIDLEFVYRIIIGVVVFIVATIVAVRIGAENLQEIIDRLAAAKLTKQEQAELKEKEEAIQQVMEELQIESETNLRNAAIAKLQQSEDSTSATDSTIE